MGLFTSKCPRCEKVIHWFLRAPMDYICECGKPVTPQEIENSWWNDIYPKLIASAPSAKSSVVTTGASAKNSVP